MPARVVAVADVYDALTSKRPYKGPWLSEEAFKYLQAHRGSHFDPRSSTPSCLYAAKHCVYRRN